MILSYDKKTKQFLLDRGGRAISQELLKAIDSGKWVLYKGRVYATYDLQEAAGFRRYAEPSAENLFKRALVSTYPVPPAPLPSFLDPHQKDGVSWVLTRSRSYLAHAPGAGKTAQAITAFALAEGTGQCVLIVPPSLTVNWEREILKFWARLRPNDWPSISILPESKNQEFMGWNADFLVIPDSMLTKPWVLERLTQVKKKLIAVDEASRFKEASSARTIALFGGKVYEKPKKKTDKPVLKMKSPGLVQDARHAVLLDGSPMPNRPMELWAPVYAMAPETIDFMSKLQFGFYFCGAEMNRRGQWEFKRASHEKELKARLQKSFMHVVTEDRLNHPERLRSLVFMNEDERTSEMKKWERRWIQSYQATGSVSDDQGGMAKQRQEIGLKKVPWAARYIRERLDSGEAILVFAWHREVIFQLSDLMKRDFTHGVIIGGTTPEDREAALRDFQSGRSNLIFANIAAGGRGHNIQRADRIIFVEPSWTDEQNKQCEKRASRRGRAQELPVKSDYLVLPGSMDEAVLSSNFTKETRVKRVIG